MVSWVKLAKIVKPSRVGREKNETDGRGVGKKVKLTARGASFFFPTDFWTVSQFYASFTHETISQFHFLSQIKQKKNHQFHPVFT